MNFPLLHLLWGGGLGGVGVQEDNLILNMSKEVQGVIRATTNYPQWGRQCEACL